MSRSPLVQFLVVGLALFGVVTLMGRGEREGAVDPDERDLRIRVEREALLAFVQARTGEADAGALAERFDAMAPRIRRDWIDRFVREEALVREAKRLGLDRDDELIRRRLVQKMEFLVAGVAAAERTLDDEEVERAYQERVDDYRVPGLATFAHVFVRDAGAATTGGTPRGRARAETLRGELEAAGVRFDEIGAHGDRFLYQRRYVDRSDEEVESHFGSAFRAALGALAPDEASWQGPLASDHGWHLVLLRDRQTSRLPAREEIEATLRRDLLRERDAADRAAGLEAVVSRFEVELEAGVAP